MVPPEVFFGLAWGFPAFTAIWTFLIQAWPRVSLRGVEGMPSFCSHLTVFGVSFCLWQEKLVFHSW